MTSATFSHSFFTSSTINPGLTDLGFGHGFKGFQRASINIHLGTKAVDVLSLQLIPFVVSAVARKTTHAYLFPREKHRRIVIQSFDV